MEGPADKPEEARHKTWCETSLGRRCLLEDYPEYRNRCLALKGEACEFAEMLETLDRLPLDVRLEVLRKVAAIQQERLKKEFGG